MKHPYKERHPKPFVKHYTERYPWTEPDDLPLTRRTVIALSSGFAIVLGMIFLIAELGKRFNF